MARVAPVASKFQAVARTNPTSEIVPEFSGKDRFFDVFARARETRCGGEVQRGNRLHRTGLIMPWATDTVLSLSHDSGQLCPRTRLLTVRTTR